MNHPHTRLLITLSLVFFLQASLCLTAQEKKYHLFTDKKAQSIEAELLSVSQDKSNVKIQRKDGREFELPIFTLSLDDQWFIKNWLDKNPLKSDYHLDVSFEKHLEDAERIEVPNYGGLKWLTDTTTFEIKIKNLSRDDLSGALLEYFIITEQGVHASPMEAVDQQTYGVKEWWYSNDPELPSLRQKRRKIAQDKPLWLIHGSAKMEDLAYNFSAEFKSPAFPLREIAQSGSRATPKDTVLGVIVRISDENGDEISVHRSSENKILKQSWNKISELPPGDRSGIPQPVSNN